MPRASFLASPRCSSLIRVLLLLILPAVFLGGCQPLSGTYITQHLGGTPLQYDLNRPNVSPTQKAYVIGYNNYYVAEALRETGLFASVEAIDTPAPSPTGVTFHIYGDGSACKDKSRTGVIGGFFYMVSLGIIPDPAIRGYSCNYQLREFIDGIPVSHKWFSVDFEHAAGWYSMLTVKEANTWKNFGRQVANLSISQLNQELKK